MYRCEIEKLKEWKISEYRKPLVIKGARQVGKTWLMKEFGRLYYENYVYFNFDEEDELKSIFEVNKNPQRIITLLSVIAEEQINPQTTLIILDEIQECPAALNSLKYFKEKASEYHIIVAGSLLGTLLAQPKSYPVGMVNLLEMGPMKFGEFLMATNENLYRYYASIEKGQKIENVFHIKLIEMYHYYLIIGGMPECVAMWQNTQNAVRAAEIQHELIQIYENDFAKYNGRVNSGRILLVFRSIVSQLAKENEKFMYTALKTGGRAREFEEAIEWLVSAGMLNRAYNISKAEHPLPAFDKLDCFKLYMFDTGLLKYMAGVDNKGIILSSDFSFKGQLAENYVLQQLQNAEGLNVSPRYYADKTGEIDFILQKGMEIIPVEVKAGKEKNAASFKKFIAKNNPEIAIRFSEMGYVKDGAVTNVPLYLADRLYDLI